MAYKVLQSLLTKPWQTLQCISSTLLLHITSSLQHFGITELSTIMLSFYKVILLSFPRRGNRASLSWRKQHAVFGLSKGERVAQRKAEFKAFRMIPYTATGSPAAYAVADGEVKVSYPLCNALQFWHFSWKAEVSIILPGWCFGAERILLRLCTNTEG